MNTRIILSAIVTLFLSANIYASQPIVYRNETVTETGKQVELTVFKSGSDVLDKRVVSSYSNNNILTEKMTYGWHESKGWLPQNKLVYTYTTSNELATLTYTKWDDVKNKWSEKSDIVSYEMTDNGLRLLAEAKKK